MTTRFHIDEVTTVVTTRNMDITVEPRNIWPIPARGSKYNIQFTEDYVDYDSGEPVVREKVRERGEQNPRRIGMKR